MDQENFSGVDTQQELVQDAAGLELVQTEYEQAEPLESLTDEPQQVEEPQQTEPPAKEPGWIRQRVDKAVQRAVRETEARMQAQFDAQFAPFRESMMQQEAEKLVASGEFRSAETALEYVRLKNGVQPPSPQAEQPRDTQGRFVSPQPQEQPAVSPMVQARAVELDKQANKIRDRRGLDVMTEFNGNPQVRERVASGEWDFYDVADFMESRSAPPVIRNAGGGSIGSTPIDSMTDEQFARLNEQLRLGHKYAPKS